MYWNMGFDRFIFDARSKKADNGGYAMRIISSDLRNEVSKNVQKNKVFGNADPQGE